MPEIQHYIVTQTRTVKVTANDSVSAALIASLAFKNGQNSGNGVKLEGLSEDDRTRLEGVWGNTAGAIKEDNLRIDKDGRG
jgi:hypothetical protein